ncbi:MAG: hypothetical protein LC637_01240, partial [Xanthomonadaceae bacterium]|nr:hypothetical protein [Xanthomonadaceae bacterium]
MSGDDAVSRFSPARILRRVRRHCWRGLVWFVIGSAVLVSIGRLLAPQADALRPLVEEFLSQSFDQPVRIERIEASWPRLSPRIRLLGLEVGESGQRLLGVDRAMLEFKLYNLLRPGRNSFELAVLGVDVRLAQNEDGQWSWQLERGGQFAAGWERSLTAGDLVLRDSGIRIVPSGFPELNWSVPEASINRVGDQLRVQLRVLPQDDAEQAFEAKLKLEMPESRLESVSGYAQAPDVELTHPAFDSYPGAAMDFRAQMKSWLFWSRSAGGRVHAQVDLHSLDAAGVAGIASSRFFVDGVWSDAEFRLELNAHEFGSSDSSLIAGLAYGRLGDRQALIAERIDLAYLHALASPWLGRVTAWPRLLEGQAEDLAFGWTADDALYLAGGRLDNFRISLKAPNFSVSAESLELELSGDRVRLHPRGQLELEYPFLYAKPIRIDQVSGSMTMLDGGLKLDRLKLRHPEFSLSADGRLDVDADGLLVDLLVDVERFEPTSLRAWLPAHGLPEKTRGWLDEALAGLDSASAVTTLFGRPANWGKRVPPGALNSVVEFLGLDLAYAKGWPTAENVDGSVEFLGESPTGVARHGTLAELDLRAQRAYIGQLRDAELELSVESVDSSAADLARLMEALPLQAAHRALESMHWQGPATASAEVWFPVKHAQDWQLTGAVAFDQSILELPDQEIVLRQLDGLVPFNRRKMGPASLHAELLGERVRFDLDSWLTPEFRLSLTGVWPTLGLIPGTWLSLRPELEREISGLSEWSIEVHPSEAGTSEPLVMVLSGD